MFDPNDISKSAAGEALAAASSAVNTPPTAQEREYRPPRGQPVCQVTSMSSLLSGVRSDLFSGKPPVHYAVANEPWGSIAFRPKEVMGLAGPPGNGKTALIMQWAVDALRLDNAARCLVVNVEMTPEKLIERQISRLGGVSLKELCDRSLMPSYHRQIDSAIATLSAISERFFFMSHPFHMGAVAESIAAVEPAILLIDYIQRIDTGDRTLDVRQRVNAVMSDAREIANAGIAVGLVSAVGRTTSKKGGGYNGEELGLGSFRESSEIEYGLDDAFVLSAEDPKETAESAEQRVLALRHVKSRNHARESLRLNFIGDLQTFKLLPNKEKHLAGPVTPVPISPDSAGASHIATAPPPEPRGYSIADEKRWQNLLGDDHEE